MRQIISVRLSPTLIDAARSKARAQNRSLSNYIEGLLHSDLQGQGGQEESPEAKALRAIRFLKAHRANLESLGVRHAWIFGSTARGEAGPDSDVDVLVEVDPLVVNNLFQYAQIQQTLQEWMNCAVDLADKARLRPEVAREAEKDKILAF
jgi:predicted nucleotidyltransferase